MKIVAEDVKALRNRMGWSTYGLAEQIGCNQSTVWRIEAGGKINRVIEKALERLIDKHPQRDVA